MNKKTEGFSYIELLIVISLIVITAMGGAFSLIRFGRAHEPWVAARSIAATLRDAEQRSIAQENSSYWGVRFDNLPGRDRYVLFKAGTASASSFATTTVVYMGNNVQFTEPAPSMSATILFDKITGAMLLPALCPSTTAYAIITFNEISIKVYCNGKIE